MRRPLSLSIIALVALQSGCESTALNQVVPTSAEKMGVFSPPFYTCLGDDLSSYEIEVSFPTDNDDNVGRAEDRNVQFSTNCDDLKLEGWSFQSNFRFTLELSRFVSQETHVCEVYLIFDNHYGTFDIVENLTLFACLAETGG